MKKNGKINRVSILADFGQFGHKLGMDFTL